MRHADAGYEDAIDCARRHGLDLPGILGWTQPSFLAWEPIANDGAAVLEAIGSGHRFRISFWDALVVAAWKADAPVLYSEGLNHGQTFGSVRVHNPFLESDP